MCLYKWFLSKCVVFYLAISGKYVTEMILWRTFKWCNKFSSWQNNTPWQILIGTECIFNGLKAVRKNSEPKSIGWRFLGVSQIKPSACGKHPPHSGDVNTAGHLVHAPVFPFIDQSIFSCNFSFFSYYPLLPRDHCFLCPSLVTCYLPSLWRRERYSNHSWGSSLSQVRLELSRCAGSLTSGYHLGGAQKCVLGHLPGSSGGQEGHQKRG